MANQYVRSGASGSNNGTSWANAWTTLAAAYTGGAAGDDFWVSDDHSESQGSAMTITCPGTLVAPCRTICVNHAGSVPPVSADLRTTAVVGTSAAFALSLVGCTYAYGITYNSGSGSSGAANMIMGGSSITDLFLDSCQVVLGSSAGASVCQIASSSVQGVRVVWNNTTFQVSSTSGNIGAGGAAEFIWKNTASAIVGPTYPTNLFGISNSGMGTTLLDGVDLSALSGKTLVANQSKQGAFYFKDCLLPASITINAALTSSSAANVYVIRSASGATAYTMEKHNTRGDQTTETTIVRTGGATVNGTAVSMKIVGTANAAWQDPFIAESLVIAPAAAGSPVNITVYGVWAGGAVPTNKQVWMEVGYLGSSSTPLLTFVTGTIADPLAAASNQPTDTSTWGGSTTPFKLTATVTPAMLGEMYIVIKVASTNATYIDPQPVLS
jgi:hypothetical protein